MDGRFIGGSQQITDILTRSPALLVWTNFWMLAKLAQCYFRLCHVCASHLIFVLVERFTALREMLGLCFDCGLHPKSSFEFRDVLRSTI